MQHQPRDGLYILDNVAPGIFGIWFENVPGRYLKSVQAGGAIAEHDSIKVAEGAALLVTFSRNVAALSGDVELTQDQAEHTANVLVLAEGENEVSPQKYHWPELDQSFHFNVTNLRPEKYRVFAIEDGDTEPWTNSEFLKALQSEGVEVELHEKDHSNVHL